MLFLKNAISSASSKSSELPDALDLLLICIESGMSVGSGVSQGRRRDRDPVDRAVGGIHAHHAELSYLQTARWL